MNGNNPQYYEGFSSPQEADARTEGERYKLNETTQQTKLREHLENHEAKSDPSLEERVDKHQFLIPRPGRVVILNDRAVSRIGRIIVPDKAKRRPTSGRVVVVGDDVEGLKPGDRVVFPQFAGTLIGFKDMPAPYLILGAEEIQAVITDDQKQVDDNVGTGYLESD